MADMTALALCPFCGNEATVLQSVKGWKVICSHRHADCPVNMRTHYHDNSADACAQWSTRPTTTADAVEVVEKDRDEARRNMEGFRKDGDPVSEEYWDGRMTALDRVLPKLRALPQPVDTGFAAGVAACVAKTEKQLADYTGIACGDEGPFTTDYAAGMNEGGIRALTDALTAFRKLSPTPAPDNALVDALRELMSRGAVLNVLEDEDRERYLAILAAQEKGQ